jgi:ABC-type transport system involved in cytochrome c biogenesis permease subunit
MPNQDIENFVRIVRKVLAPIASLKITVALFALSLILVFFGTLAQTSVSMWTVVDQYFYSWFVKIDLRHLDVFLGTFKLYPVSPNNDASFPFLGGKSLGWLMLINLLAAHTLQLINLIQGVKKQAARSTSTTTEVMRVLLKRSGIYIIHAGVILLLVGEAITREHAVEQQMRIPEGQSVNMTIDTKGFELAFIDKKSSATEEKVVVVNQSSLIRSFNTGETITDPQLPVDLKVKDYFYNSKLLDGPPAKKNLATAGYGLSVHVVKKEPVPGVDTSNERDVPSAYVEFFDKTDNKSLGVYLVSGLLKDQPLSPKVLATTNDGALIEKGSLDRTYQIGLRNVQLYKPYSLHLIKFTFDKYMGTTKAKNYASEVRLIDTELGVDQVVTISMNNPLRHRGETFYQADFDKETEKSTTLQVVKNPASDLPYVACILTGTGMLVHFGIMLVTFALRLINETDQEAKDTKRVMKQHFPIMSPVFFVLDLMKKVVTKLMPPRQTLKDRWLPVGIGLLLCVLLFGSQSYPKKPKAGELDLSVLARVPVVEGGRTKPLDTVARVDLRIITEQESVWVNDPNYTAGGMSAVNEFFAPYTKGKKKIGALEWFLNLASSPQRDTETSGQDDVFRIHNEEVYKQLGLARREGYRYSYAEIAPAIGKLGSLAEKARNTDKAKRSLFQTKVLELSDHVQRYLGVNFGHHPLTVPPSETQPEWKSVNDIRTGLMDDETFKKRVRDRCLQAGLLDVMVAFEFIQDLNPAERGLYKVLVEKKELTPEMQEQFKTELAALGQKFALLSEVQRPLTVKILQDDTKGADFEKLRQTLEDEGNKMLAEKSPAVGAWQQVLKTYREGKPEPFNEAVEAYRAIAEGSVSPYHRTMSHFEEWLNRTALYYTCTVAYAVAGVMLLAAFLCLTFAPRTGRLLRRSTFWLLLFTFLIHSFTLFGRMALMERPLVFVTNLYSSAVFIGWSVVGLCLIIELMTSIGVSSLCGAILGFATSLAAHQIAVGNDTLEMMEAVLDTNGWLATHVTTVTLGYSATYFAGMLGKIYIVAYIIPKNFIRRKIGITDGLNVRDQELGKLLGQMMYGVVAFAMLLSFVGTVLGGIWADQSWGRFWGWDPKENGAVLIVLWNAIILHARWGGLIKERGMAVLAVVGTMITTWSWFGTNQLSVGLHAYGFNTTLAEACKWSWIVAGAWVVAGVMPWHWIWTGQGAGQAATSPPA